MKIAVHEGKFHADDVFAAAILTLVFPKIKIIRTRDEEKLKSVDMRIDVGGKYDPKTGDFDHHQPTFKEKRSNGIPYASAGLIWKHFGDKLTSPEVKKDIDERIIQYIDAGDSGVDTFKSEIPIYTIADFIASLNPSWPDITNELFDKNFYSAVEIISNLLKREIRKAEETFKSESIILKKVKESKKDYIVLDSAIPWKETVTNHTKLKYVVRYSPVQDDWCVHAIPVSLNSFTNRKDLPKKWGGLSGKELQEVTGVKDAIFCHKNLFLAVAKSKEGAIKLVELALKK